MALKLLLQQKQSLMKFKGAMAPVLTPFDQNGEINVSQIPGYAKYLVENKVTGLYICGTNGEGYNLTNAERLTVAQAWHQAVRQQNLNLLSVVNVSSYCVKEALEMAKQVDESGIADAIAILPPNYYKPTSIDQWLDFMKGFGRSAPNTPLLYYHIPSMTGELNLDLVEAIGAAVKQIPQFAAIKFTDGNVLRLAGLDKYKNNLKVFLGLDQSLVTVLTALDYDSSISGLWNLPGLPDTYHRFLEFNGRLELAKARVEQQKLLEENARLRAPGNLILTTKAAFNDQCKHLGLDVGHPRPPISFHYQFK